jgi:hypothetical protein
MHACVINDFHYEETLMIFTEFTSVVLIFLLCGIVFLQKLRPVIPSNCPPAMRALIEQCWSLQPDKRPDFWQIVKVLEQFESSLARDGTLTLVQNPRCPDQKKGLLHWIQKLGPVHQNNGPKLKPKFT